VGWHRQGIPPLGAVLVSGAAVSRDCSLAGRGCGAGWWCALARCAPAVCDCTGATALYGPTCADGRPRAAASVQNGLGPTTAAWAPLPTSPLFLYQASLTAPMPCAAASLQTPVGRVRPQPRRVRPTLHAALRQGHTTAPCTLTHIDKERESSRANTDSCYNSLHAPLCRSYEPCTTRARRPAALLQRTPFITVRESRSARSGLCPESSY
jgi:hypothetical protein